MKALFILVLLLVAGADLRPCVADEVRHEHQIKADIWALETAYVTGFQAARHDQVISLWHPRFIGWPAAESLPVDKKGVVDYLKRVAPVPGNWSFRIERGGIRISGDVAITHYHLHIQTGATAGTGGERVSRVTHTWVRTASGWQILAGMSARP